MKKTMIMSIFALSVFALAGAGYVSAQGGAMWGGFGGHEAMLENKAEILGVTVEDLRSAREEGKSFHDIAEEQGITQEEMHEQMEGYMQGHLEQQVVEGVITQEQMDERLEWMEEHEEKGGCHSGFHKGGGFGKRGFHNAQES